MSEIKIKCSIPHVKVVDINISLNLLTPCRFCKFSKSTRQPRKLNMENVKTAKGSMNRVFTDVVGPIETELKCNGAKL